MPASIKFAASPTKGDPFSATPDPLDYYVVAGKPVSEGADPARVAVPGKEGWDYVWVTYAQKTQDGRTVTVVPFRVMVCTLQPRLRSNAASTMS